jgi:hypothetical protein
MKKIILFLMVLICVQAADFSTSFLVGYNGGTSLEINGRVSEFAEDFPLQLQLGIAYTGLNPGNAPRARRIFINAATGGEPEKSGRIWDVSFDFLYRVGWFKIKQAFIHAGPRYAMYTGNFKFIGGNEDFDVTGDQWGLGAGIISFFPMNRRLYLTLTAGTDYYFLNDLTGHDTTYRPDDENINPREDFTYKDADNAINQPKFQVRLMMGISYRFH